MDQLLLSWLTPLDENRDNIRDIRDIFLPHSRQFFDTQKRLCSNFILYNREWWNNESVIHSTIIKPEGNQLSLKAVILLSNWCFNRDIISKTRMLLDRGYGICEDTLPNSGCKPLPSLLPLCGSGSALHRLTHFYFAINGSCQRFYAASELGVPSTVGGTESLWRTRVTIGSAQQRYSKSMGCKAEAVVNTPPSSAIAFSWFFLGPSGCVGIAIQSQQWILKQRISTGGSAPPPGIYLAYRCLNAQLFRYWRKACGTS